jgi:catechol 2,3-dioxygenase-like lactoylglutathione lyase family enzyme
MPNYQFHHLHLISEDPGKVADFYEKLLGAKKMRVREHGVNLDLNGTKINIRSMREDPLVAGSPVKNGFEHYAIRTDNIQEAIAEMKANGITVLQEIDSPEPNIKIAYILAPGNVPIEIIEADH